MRLLNIKSKNKRYRVIRFEGGRGMRMKLLSLGLDEGDVIQIIAGGNERCPVMIENITKGTKISIGRGIAYRIIVEPVDEYD